MVIKLILFIHIMFAVLWIGGMIYALFFLRPSLKKLNTQEKINILKDVHGRFLSSVFISILGLFITGLILLKMLRPDLLNNGLFHLKLLLFFIMTINFLYIYFVLYKKENFRKLTSFISINLTLGISVIFIISYIR